MEIRKNSKDWTRFIETGRVEDYLRYCQRAREEPKPGRRIMGSSRHKQFY